MPKRNSGSASRKSRLSSFNLPRRYADVGEWTEAGTRKPPTPTAKNTTKTMQIKHYERPSNHAIEKIPVSPFSRI